MTKHRFRYKLLLDENLSPRQRYRILNSSHDVKHLIHDYSANREKIKKNKPIEDIEVYKLAERESRLIITHNNKHFIKLANKSENTGVLGLSPHLTFDDYIDTRVNAYLSKKPRTELFGHYNFIPHQNEKVI